MRIRMTFLLVAFVLCSVFVVDTASADPPVCVRIDPATGECLIGVTVPGTPGGPGRPGDPPGTGRPVVNTPQPCIDDLLGVEVPCTTPAGYWSNAYGCYISLLQPPPPFSHPLWEGNTTGAIYNCGGMPFWSAAAPAGPAAPPDPRVLAQQAISTMGLHAIEIGIVPEPGPDSIGLIGLPTWMWVNQPTENTVGPISRSASAAGYTVTATATVSRVVWDMGDGHSVTCTGAGTPYADGFGAQPSPDCGHRYTRISDGQPGNAYTVAATSYWTIQWAGIGQSGTINLDFTAETNIRIGEMQVLVTR